MFENYYLQQLANLRKKVIQFSQTHPAIAPLLRENSIDPDVERLLEGSAFLNAILHEKLDDDLPELIRGIAEILFPHLLRPLPSASIIAFTSKDSLLEKITVASGTQVASVPLDGTQCQFRTTMNVDISPLRVTGVNYEKNTSKEEICTVQLHLNGITLSNWKCQDLTFFTGGEFVDATQFFMRIRTALKKVIVKSGSKSFTLQPNAVSLPGFQSDSLLYSTTNQQFCRYSLLTEYFMCPEKFLFYKVSGLGPVSAFGESTDFELQFVLTSQKEQILLKKEFFTLFAVPVVNLFPMDAEPVQVDHTSERMPIIPSSHQRHNYDIYTVDSVTGYTQGTVDRKSYLPYNKFKKVDNKNGFFQIHHSKSIAFNVHEVKISLCYETPPPLIKEILSVDLTCTNAHLPARLKTGDISMPTSQSPEFAIFQNITAVTEQVDVFMEKNEIWRLLSHFSTNLLPVIDEESLRELLRQYTFHNQRSDTGVLNNLKRINGIEKFSSQPIERIVKGILMRGILLQITFDETQFSSAGDAYLFCSVLDHFLSLYTSINTFTQLESYNSKTGERLEWLPRIGEIPAVIEHLCKNGNTFSLVQALRVLRYLTDEDDQTSISSRVGIRADLELTPPRGEIQSISKHHDSNSDLQILITVTLLEMYGTGSPLPLFYTEELFREQIQGNCTSRSFIDLISSILYESYYKIWEKCSPMYSLYESPDADFWERLYCIAGLCIDSLKRPFTNPAIFLAFSALASRPVKTAEGLRSILSELTSDPNLNIEQCVIRKAPIPLAQRCVVGKTGNSMGETIYLGNRLLDRMNAIRINVGPMSVDSLLEYLPNGSIIKLFTETIQFYIDKFIVWDCRIGVDTSNMKTIQPGNRKSSLLGWNTWLFSGKLKADVVYTSIKPCTDIR